MNFRTVVAAGAALTALACTGAARADFIMHLLTIGAPPASSADIQFLDNDATYDSNSDDKIIEFNRTVGAFKTNITIGTSNSPGDATDGGILQVMSLNIRNTTITTAKLQIWFTDTDFNQPATNEPGFLQSLLAATFINGKAADYVTFQSFADPSDGQFGQVDSTVLQTITGMGGSAAPDQQVTFTPSGAAYSLTNVLNLSLSAKSQVNISATTQVIPNPTTPVPEPAAVAALALGGLALLVRRR